MHSAVFAEAQRSVIVLTVGFSMMTTMFITNMSIQTSLDHFIMSFFRLKSINEY